MHVIVWVLCPYLQLSLSGEMHFNRNAKHAIGEKPSFDALDNAVESDRWHGSRTYCLRRLANRGDAAEKPNVCNLKDYTLRRFDKYYRHQSIGVRRHKGVY